MNNEDKACPLCGKNVKQWTDYYGRYNAACPHCGCAERHRITALYLNSIDTNFNNLLHVAPESWLQNKFKNITNNYIAGDINPSKYSDLSAVYLDVTDIDYDYGTFDCIYASHILEHITDDVKAMTEMYNVLTTNGKLLAMIPQKLTLGKTYEDPTIDTDAARLETFGQKDHVRWYGLDFTTRLKQAGFYVEVYYTCSKYEHYIEKMLHDDKHQIASDNDAIKFGLGDQEMLYVCTKK